jgi:putative ABC transport system ATP-binding protein
MIVLKDIYRSYELPKITVEVLKGINLEAEQGDFIAIMGPSGSGKSTLLNIIGCLDRPTSGRYLLDNVDVSTKNDNELAEIRSRSIGFVFQSFNLLPRFPAWKNVELPLLYGGVEPKMRKQKAVDMLGRMGLGDRSDHKPNELSGGEQQRVAIARALINSPVIILADEPTGNLDSKVGKEIMEIFAELNRGGVTIILVTHEMEIAGFSKRIITMRDGVCYSGCA